MTKVNVLGAKNYFPEFSRQRKNLVIPQQKKISTLFQTAKADSEAQKKESPRALNMERVKPYLYGAAAVGLTITFLGLLLSSQNVNSTFGHETQVEVVDEQNKIQPKVNEDESSGKETWLIKDLITDHYDEIVDGAILLGAGAVFEGTTRFFAPYQFYDGGDNFARPKGPRKKVPGTTPLVTVPYDIDPKNFAWGPKNGKYLRYVTERDKEVLMGELGQAAEKVAGIVVGKVPFVGPWLARKITSQ